MKDDTTASNISNIKIEDLHKARANSAIEDIIRLYGNPGSQSASGVTTSMSANDMHDMLGNKPESQPEARRPVLRYEGIDSDIKWNSEFSMTELTDEQHRRFIESINKLQRACTNELAVEQSDEMLKTLLEVMPAHFEEEQRIMTQYRYSRFAEHRKKHWEFLAVLERLERLYRMEGKTKEFMLDMFSQVIRWYFSHLPEDRALAEFYRKATGR